MSKKDETKHSIIIEIDTNTKRYKIQTTFTDRRKLTEYFGMCAMDYLQNEADYEVQKANKPN